MTNLEQFIEDNEVYFVCVCGSKHAVAEGFETRSSRAVLVRPNWYNTDGVFFEPKLIAEGEIVEVIVGEEWRIGKTRVVKCDPIVDVDIIASVGAWRIIRGADPEASRANCIKYLLDNYRKSFLSESDLFA